MNKKQQINDTLLQQVSENNRVIHQVENSTFNNDDVITKSNFMKDTVKDINFKSSKDKTSKYELSSKLINYNTMKNPLLTKEEIKATYNWSLA